MQRLLRLAEVLEVLQVSRSTFYAHTKTGQIRLTPWRAGGIRRYRPADVEREMARRAEARARRA